MAHWDNWTKEYTKRVLPVAAATKALTQQVEMMDHEFFKSLRNARTVRARMEQREVEARRQALS